VSAVQQLTSDAASLRFEKMTLDDLPDVMTIEDSVYPHPWTRGNFLDSLYSGYQSWILRDASGSLIGYFLLMFAIDEAHLLNITVRDGMHGRGFGRMQLDKAVALAREHGMTSILLEVRPSNLRALAVYQKYGYVQIGRRKSYYPAADNTREDAIVMRLAL